MKYVSILMASRHLARDGSAGWTAFGHDHSKIIEAVKTLDPQEYGGITLNRCCGAHYHARHASNDVDGSRIDVYPAGPDDHPYPTALGKAIRDLGFKVAFFAGWPRFVAGFDAIKSASDIGYTVFVDSSGGATNGWLVEKMGGIIEPMPPIGRRPKWITANTMSFMLAERADTLARRGEIPALAHIGWNGNESGDSFYDAQEVERWHDMGYHVHVPAGSILSVGDPA
jgi:hypothetical protein